ncbi:MAG: CHAD domain-containing protein, partial [Planctomycetota bacterium]|nr:CHAD domain-containing protein [Planctomycetota bacterium]
DLRPEAEPDFGGAAVVALAEGLVAELLRYLAAVQSIADEDEAHEARILGKRLRYHIEPFQAHIPEARGVVRACKQLQNVLGDINDACVLRAWIRAERDAAPAEAHAGIEHVLERITARHEALHARLESEWLADGGARLREQVDALAAGMGPLLAPPTEIERKYVLTTAPQLPAGAESAEIEQGYLPVEGFEDRVRRTTKASGVKRVRTLKVGSGLQRFEAEHELDDETFAALWALTEGRRVCKRRHVVAVGAHVWEVDEFLDRDLWLAEVELASADEVAEVPAWLAAAGAREVTASGEYGNRRLAR